VTSHVNARFRRHFANLPKRIQEQSRRAYQLLKTDPTHRGLEFKKLPPHQDIWSVRINDNYRAVGLRDGEAMVWFFIGTHAEYDALLARL
jgi:mRNA-degrading endonuclease RelE of RelBE toxin-antitoxin system